MLLFLSTLATFLCLSGTAIALSEIWSARRQPAEMWDDPAGAAATTVNQRQTHIQTQRKTK